MKKKSMLLPEPGTVIVYLPPSDFATYYFLDGIKRDKNHDKRNNGVIQNFKE